jgi:LPS sulfotransferase NodH
MAAALLSGLSGLSGLRRSPGGPVDDTSLAPESLGRFSAISAPIPDGLSYCQIEARGGNFKINNLAAPSKSENVQKDAMSAVAKFVVLALARTGSWYVIESLRLHPHIAANGEVLNNENKLHWWSDRTQLTPAQLISLGFQPDPRMSKQRIMAVGFKVIGTHLEDERPALRARTRKLLGLVAADEEIRVILLRRNYVEMYRSLVQAMATGQFRLHRESLIVPPPRVYLPPGELRRVCTQSDKFYAWASQLFTGHPLLELRYEDLLQRPDAELAEVQRFLNVPIRVLANPDICKQEWRPLWETVLNFDDLRRELRATKFERLLYT